MKVSHAIVWFIFLSHKGDPAKSPFRNAGAFMWAVFHLFPYLSLTTSSWHLLMTISWHAEEPCLGSAVECYPLSFIFPDENNGALRDFRFIFSSFLFCGSFCIIAGFSWSNVFILHFCLWSHFLRDLEFSSGFYRSLLAMCSLLYERRLYHMRRWPLSFLFSISTATI